MIELRPNMAVADASQYLQMLSKSMDDDLMPLFGAAGGAPFALVREVMCYVDHLGALLVGRCTGGGTSTGGRQFLSGYMAEVDPSYRSNGGMLYEMYRHGTVHNFAPVKLKRNGITYSWWVHNRGRNDILDGPLGLTAVEHLELVHPEGSSKAWLPVSTRCLFDDVKRALRFYETDLAGKPELLVNWNSHAQFIASPKPWNPEMNPARLVE
jgi:hypothetical protein